MTTETKPLSYSYDLKTDVMEIEGMFYTGSLFRHFAAGGLALDVPMTITKRDNGVLTLKTISEEEKVAAAVAPVQTSLTDCRDVLASVRAALQVPENTSIMDWAPKVIQFRDLLFRSVRACAGIGSPVLCQCAVAHRKHNEAIPQEPTT